MPLVKADGLAIGARPYLMTNHRVEGLMVQEDAAFVGGISPAMQTLESVIGEIAPTNIPVLLVGESGTGKEMFAKRVHRLSGHSEEPLARISCAAMNPTTFSGELGLHTNGKSDAAKVAYGTVFFDEISELDSACQRNLLCALPEGDAGARRGLLTRSRDFDDEPESR